jgi:hypothetical protein
VSGQRKEPLFRQRIWKGAYRLVWSAEGASVSALGLEAGLARRVSGRSQRFGAGSGSGFATAGQRKEPAFRRWV